MKRSQIREQIFKLLFRVEFNKAEEMNEQVNLFMEYPTLDNDEDDYKDVTFTESEEAYILSKYDDIMKHLDELDKIIDDTSKSWKSDRVGKVELTILRLAIYEIKFDEEIPVSVAIDQAVELAKKFGRDESYAFVNGLLAKVAA